MPSLYPSSTPVGAENLRIIDQEMRATRGMHYIGEIFAVDADGIPNGDLKWQAQVIGNEVKVYASVVDKHGNILFPRVSPSQKNSTLTLVMPALYTRNIITDPVGCKYQFKEESEPVFNPKVCMVQRSDDEYKPLFDKQMELVDRLDKFLGDDLKQFICYGRDIHGQIFQDRFCEAYFNHPKVNKDIDKFGEYMSELYDDPTNETFDPPKRSVIAMPKLKLNDMNWEKFHCKTKTPDLPSSTIAYLDTWTSLADEMPAVQRKDTLNALATIKAQLLATQTTKNPKSIHTLPITDSEGVEMSEEDIFHHLSGKNALVSITLCLSGVRFQKKIITDVDLHSVEVHVNGIRTEGIVGFKAASAFGAPPPKVDAPIQDTPTVPSNADFVPESATADTLEGGGDAEEDAIMADMEIDEPPELVPEVPKVEEHPPKRARVVRAK